MMLELAAVLWLAAPPPAPVENSPSAALLAFLGSFEDDDGQWVDPLALEAVAEQAPEPDAEKDDEAKHADEPIDTDRRAGADDH